MKRKNWFILSTILIFNSLFGQSKLTEFKNSLKISSSDIKDVTPIVNKNNGDLAYFIADAKNVYAYKLNSDFKLKNKLSSEEKRRKYKTIIGYSISENGNYTAFLTNKNRTSFLKVTFSFNDKKTTSKEFKLNYSSEKFIQTASINNKFYLISTRSGIDGLFIYEFNSDGSMKKNNIDLSHLNFISKYGKKIKVGDFLTRTYNQKDINKVDESVPNAIEVVANHKKMYIRDNNIIFTFDNNKSLTQVLSINLNTLKATSKTFTKPLSETKNSRKNTNSFIYNDYIFVLASSKEELVLDINDYDSGKAQKKLSIFKDQPITFKNTPIIQEGGFYNSRRELEKTKKFLRKINAGKIGVAVRKSNKNYQITLGGYTLQQSGGMMMGGMVGGMIGGIAVASIGNATVFFNPIQFSYNASVNTKSTRIECLFNTNFEHINGEIEENVFDKMKDDDYSKPIGLTVIKYKDYFIKGTYDRKTKMYILKKYTD